MKKINASHTPLYREAGFNLQSAKRTKEAFAAEANNEHEPEDYIYSRYRNPTTVAAEKQIMALENCKWAVLVETGMAAIDIAVSIFQKGKDTRPSLYFHEIYGGTNYFIDNILIKRRNLDVHRFYAKDGHYDFVELERLLDEIQPEFLYFEAVSNPMLIVADVKRIISLAKQYEAKIIVDNTFGTPYLWKPLMDGADLVIHSVTKYLSGHGNISAGVICGNNKELMKEAIEYRKLTGHFISPDDAYRLGTQLKSFELRFQKHCDNAMALATFLEDQPQIEEVLYPGLESHPTQKEAIDLFGDKGFGGMITFDTKGDSYTDKEEKRDRFIAALEDTIPLIPTLGEVDTILLPIEPVWGDKYPLPGMIRLSVGIENIDRLKDLIGGALNQL
ncbi:PLP-dependent aspartate aminotransferase family protein [Ancylomarina sp. 16SWW S1-10-2]|uniref:trans-sulfuration enzyme family protein n=1 Tax=Ancylomarina sp. 16SWW S1-10-2 TaxID=2499681 RepID=UPI0012AD6C21|nr:PLP-dependent transferase [Ancylomarina sp. 16SWW S1-10-2]MRT91718.1 aminotransferase class I/II-fold pyridoxal phosphate-dependent enzyme [Ancylomarina sp. 16SWW S1-10-2]